MRRFTPPQIIILSFLSCILVGTILLCMPFSTKEQISVIDALFTATSATCVTGLVVKNTGAFFTTVGQLIILTLIQVGGLGIMTFSTAFAIILGRKLTLRGNLIVQSALDHFKIEGLAGLIRHILLITFSIESIGALILFLRWMSFYKGFGEPLIFNIFNSIFHSISAFCNAGFSLFSNNLRDFKGDVIVNIVMMSLIVTGGIGFIVLLDLPKLKFWRRDRQILFSKICLQTKIALSITAILILTGSFLIFIFEANDTLAGLSLKEKILASCFQSVTPRTAGFNTLPTANMTTASLLLIVILMFIGASPGGTGGGIKTVTFGVLFAAAVSMFKNRDRITLFRRTIPRVSFRKAAMVFTLALGLVLFVSIALSISEGTLVNEPNYFLRLLFEVISAFGTVGLSTGITPHLSNIGKLFIILTMFIGRVGPLTLALAIAMKQEVVEYKFPEEKIMVG